MGTTRWRGMHVHLLGPLHVEVDGRVLDVSTWKSKRAVTLLKYLVARAGERVPRDVLVDLLWPDSEDGYKSTHNLHTVVYYLRRTLEPELRRYGIRGFCGMSTASTGSTRMRPCGPTSKSSVVSFGKQRRFAVRTVVNHSLYTSAL